MSMKIALIQADEKKRGKKKLTRYTTISDYGPSRTRQEAKDECDINRIMKRAQKTGTISHLSKYGEHYGDFEDIDLMEAYRRTEQATAIFNAAPSEIKSEFNHDPAQFFNAVQGKSSEERDALLLRLAQPGRQNLRVNVSEPAPTPAEGDVTPSEGGTPTPTE